MDFRAQYGLGFRVQSLGFRASGLGGLPKGFPSGGKCLITIVGMAVGT